MAFHHHNKNLPVRQETVSSSGYQSDDDAVPTGDPSSTLGLLEERLQAWKHMTVYLEDYVKAVAKEQKSQAKDSEKILKTLNSPLKEGHHFSQELGGVAGLFENLRANTQAQSQLYVETEQNIEKSVLPIFERLHKEIKAKRKELDSGAGKQSKAVDTARNSSQKHIEMLGQHTATFDSAGGHTLAKNDPYVLQRGVWYRLNKQLAEENNHKSDLINIQNSFQSFENHVISTVQSGLATFNQYMSNQHDRSKAMYGDMAQTAQRIDGNFEWQGFVQRNGNVLISPNAPNRSIDSVSFPNMDHRATKPLIEGTLARKGKGLGALASYKPYYCAVTPAGFLHEYKDNDNFRTDPEPEHSLFLPDCVVGAVDGQKFTIKGKDSSGSKITQKMSMSSEYAFKAHTASDAQQWHSVIASVCSGTSSSLPNSPVSRQTSATYPPQQPGLNTAAAQQTGTTGTMMSPQSAQPYGENTTSPQQMQPGVMSHEMQPGSATTTSPTHGQGMTGQQTGTIPQHEMPTHYKQDRY